MRAVLVSNDLMVVSRVDGAAARAGSTVRAANSGAAAIELLRPEPVDILIVDLATPLADLRALVDQIKSATANAPRIVAFGPHVHEDRLAAARTAGCDLVISRGQFFAQIDSLLAE